MTMEYDSRMQEDEREESSSVAGEDVEKGFGEEEFELEQEVGCFSQTLEGSFQYLDLEEKSDFSSPPHVSEELGTDESSA